MPTAPCAPRVTKLQHSLAIKEVFPDATAVPKLLQLITTMSASLSLHKPYPCSTFRQPILFLLLQSTPVKAYPMALSNADQTAIYHLLQLILATETKFRATKPDAHLLLAAVAPNPDGVPLGHIGLPNAADNCPTAFDHVFRAAALLHGRCVPELMKSLMTPTASHQVMEAYFLLQLLHTATKESLLRQNKLQNLKLSSAS